MTKAKTSKQPKVGHSTRSDGGDAFFPDPSGTKSRPPDDFAEELAADFLTSATSGEEQGQESHEQQVDEEEGGPFVESSGKIEFAEGTDASNPPDAERSPFPEAASPRKGESLARPRFS